MEPGRRLNVPTQAPTTMLYGWHGWYGGSTLAPDPRRNARPSSRQAALVLVASSVLGCSGSGKTEAAALIAAVDRYRDASDAAKIDRARSVASIPCSVANVCEAKRACEDAIGPSAQALDIKDRVTERVRDLREGRLAPDSPEATALPPALRKAESLLAEGRVKMPDCERLIVKLRVAFGL